MEAKGLWARAQRALASAGRSAMVGHDHEGSGCEKFVRSPDSLCWRSRRPRRDADAGGLRPQGRARCTAVLNRTGGAAASRCAVFSRPIGPNFYGATKPDPRTAAGAAANPNGINEPAAAKILLSRLAPQVSVFPAPNLVRDANSKPPTPRTRTRMKVPTRSALTVPCRPAAEACDASLCLP
jgi:hypothetical protein